MVFAYNSVAFQDGLEGAVERVMPRALSVYTEHVETKLVWLHHAEERQPYVVTTW